MRARPEDRDEAARDARAPASRARASRRTRAATSSCMADPTDLFASDELARVLAQADSARARERSRAAARRSTSSTGAPTRSSRSPRSSTRSSSETDVDLERAVGRGGLARRAGHQAHPVDVPGRRARQRVGHPHRARRALPADSPARRRPAPGADHRRQSRGQALVTRLKLMCGLDIAEKRKPQDGRFSIKIDDKSLDVRLSTMPIYHGEAIVLRLARSVVEPEDVRRARHAARHRGAVQGADRAQRRHGARHRARRAAARRRRCMPRCSTSTRRRRRSSRPRIPSSTGSSASIRCR